MESNPIRRSLLGAGLLGAGTLLGKLFPTPVFAQTVENSLSSPSQGDLMNHASTPIHGGSMTMGEVNHVRNGFDPYTMLNDWDTGKVSTLSNGRTLREYEIFIEEKEIEVAPGVFYLAWTYNGRVPGPTLRVTEGDRIRIRFRNPGRHPHTCTFTVSTRLVRTAFLVHSKPFQTRK